MDKLKSSELLKWLKSKKVNINKRTFEYYQRLGLLPKPEKRVGIRGRGVYGYYNPEFIRDTLEMIFKYKKNGKTLEEIRLILMQEVSQKINSILKEYGFSHYVMPEISGMPRIPSLDEYIQSMKVKYKPKEAEESYWKMFGLANYLFAKNIFDNFNWWDSSESIEVPTLEYMFNKIEGAKDGLGIAIYEVTYYLGDSFMYLFMERPKLTKKEKFIDSFLDELSHKFHKKLCILEILLCRIGKRLAELTGEYRGFKKDYWDKRIKDRLKHFGSLFGSLEEKEKIMKDGAKVLIKDY